MENKILRQRPRKVSGSNLEQVRLSSPSQKRESTNIGKAPSNSGSVKVKNKKQGAGKPAPRKHNPAWKDNTITARSDKRKSELQAAAELNGFETWSGMMTYIKNMALQGKATVSKDNA